MSRGLLRRTLVKRVEAIVEHWPLLCRAENGSPRVPRVFEQFHPVANDKLPDAPGICVHVGKVEQRRESTGDEVRTASIAIMVLVIDPETEQGYRDAENMLEAIEQALIEEPFLEGGRFKLVEPWETDLSGKDYPMFQAILTCSAQMPALSCLIGPDGSAIGEDI